MATTSQNDFPPNSSQLQAANRGNGAANLSNTGSGGPMSSSVGTQLNSPHIPTAEPSLSSSQLPQSRFSMRGQEFGGSGLFSTDSSPNRKARLEKWQSQQHSLSPGPGHAGGRSHYFPVSLDRVGKSQEVEGRTHS